MTPSCPTGPPAPAGDDGEPRRRGPGRAAGGAPLDRELTVAEFTARYPSAVPAATVALLNQLDPTGTLAAGSLAKQVVGGSAP